MPDTKDKSFKEAIERAGKRALGVQTRRVMCKFTPEELQKLGHDLAQQVDKFDKADEAETARKKAEKEHLTALQDEIGRIARLIRAGEELRDVAVELVLEATASGPMVRETRTDTGEVLQMRQPTKKELQPDMGL